MQALPRLLVVDHSTSLFADRWCILTFIGNSRNLDSISALGYRSPYPYSVSAAGSAYALYSNKPEYSDESSLINRLLALRTMRLMTLWQGRETALVFGLNETGYLGIRLDEAVASND